MHSDMRVITQLVNIPSQYISYGISTIFNPTKLYANTLVRTVPVLSVQCLHEGFILVKHPLPSILLLVGSVCFAILGTPLLKTQLPATECSCSTACMQEQNTYPVNWSREGNYLAMDYRLHAGPAIMCSVLAPPLSLPNYQTVPDYPLMVVSRPPTCWRVWGLANDYGLAEFQCSRHVDTRIKKKLFNLQHNEQHYSKQTTSHILTFCLLHNNNIISTD